MKKLISYLAALAMTVSLAPMSIVHADTKINQDPTGFVALESENAQYTGFEVNATEKAFGGSLLVAGSNSLQESPTADWTFDVSEGGTFDVWILATGEMASRPGYLSTYSWAFNNDEMQMGAASEFKLARYQHFIGSVGLMDVVSYLKTAGKVTLNSGENTFHYSANERALNDGYYINCIDRVLLVPSAWKWTPSSEITLDDWSTYLNEKPYDSSIVNAGLNGEFVLEAEKGDIAECAVVSSSRAFGGAYVYNFNGEGNNSPSIEWKINVHDEKAYDIWALALKSPSTGGEMNTMQMFIDEGEAQNVKKDNSDNSRSRYTATDIGLPDYFPVCWVKVFSGTVIGKGTKTVCYNTNTVGGNNLFALDRVVISPTDNCWMPNSNKDYISSGSTEYLTDDIPCVMDAPFVPDENNVIWMEAENADTTTGFNVSENTNASGGKQIAIDTSSWPSYSADYTLDAKFLFDVKKAGSYDVWVLAPNDPASSAYSDYQTSLNGEEYKTYRNGFNYGGFDISQFPTVYDTGVTNAGGAKWVRVNTAAQLSEGRNRFVYTIGAARGIVIPSGLGYHMGQLDCVAVVPSSLNWVPNKSVDKPQVRENGYAWINMTSTKNETRFTKREDANPYLISWGDKSITGNEKLDYSFNLAKDGNYDIYFLGTRTDKDYISKLYMDIDSSAETLVDEGDTKRAAATEVSGTFMRSLGEEASQEYWQKLKSNVSISAGEHTLNMEWAERTGQSEDGIVYENHYLISSVVAIIPSGWEWSMPEETTAITDTALDFDVNEKADSLTERYQNGVTGDLEGLNVYGSAGSSFTYVSKTPKVVTNDGKVTRSDDADVTGRMEILAHKIPSADGYVYNSVQGDSTVIKFTVKKLEDVDYNNLKAIYSDNTEIAKNALESGKTINASVNIKKNKDKVTTAMLATALYENGVLKKVDVKDVTLTTEYQSVTSSITLPADTDMSRYSIKVFLWDSLEYGNPYASEPLEY